MIWNNFFWRFEKLISLSEKKPPLHCTDTLIFYLCFPWKYEKKTTLKNKMLQQNWRIYQYFWSAQNQPKSQILFHKNSSLHDFYKMTLSAARLRTSPPCAVEVNSAGLESIFRFPQLTFLYPGKGTSAFVKRLLDINRLG